MSKLTDAPTLPAGLTVREATTRDIPEMLEVVNAAFVEENFFVNRPRTNAAQLEEQFRLGRFLLAHQEAQLVASVYYEVLGERGYIGMLAVRPGHQRNGLGRRMLQMAEQTLRGLGCSIAQLTVVSVRTELPPVYRKFGYIEAGIEDPPKELMEKLTMPVKLIRMEKRLR